MSDVQLSSTTRSLLKAARADGPEAVARTKIWEGVSSAAKIGAGAGSAATAASLGTSTKLLVMGALLGSAATVGLAMMLLHVRPAASSVQAMTQPPVVRQESTLNVPDSTPGAEASTGEPEEPVAPTVQVQALPRVSLGRSQAKVAPKAVKPNPSDRATPADEDALMHEASLVAEARGALLRGDALTALRVIRAARALPMHQLEPEEWSIEAQTLRSLGRADESLTVDELLKSKYPEHPLSR